MGDRNELDIERAEVDPATGRHHRDRNFWRVALADAHLASNSAALNCVA